MNRRRLLKIFSITGTSLAAIAWGSKLYWDDYQTSRRSNLLISGAASMVSYVQRVADAFSKLHKNIDIVAVKGHSRGALIALRRDGIDLAVMDRNLSLEEFNLTDHNILTGIDGLGIVVNIESPIHNLSSLQVRDIFEGRITNWKEVGGPNTQINVYGRREGSTTRASIEDIVMSGGTLSRKTKEMRSADELSKAIAHDKSGIGYISVRTMQDTTRALSINGIALNEKNLLISLYPLVRPMFYVVNGEATPDLKKFIDFTLSKSGQKILADMGMVNVSSA